MKILIQNPLFSRIVRVGLGILGVALVAGLAFLQGMVYANKKATLRMAQDECFYTVCALRSLKEPAQQKVAVLFDSGMDVAVQKLAEISLSNARDIKRVHYNVLVRVRDYRKQYGRDPQNPYQPEGRDIDKKVADAIAYLESIHDLKQWSPFKFDIEDGTVKAE